MRYDQKICLALLLLCLLTAGCSVQQRRLPERQRPSGQSGRFFQALDRTVEQSGVRDASAVPVRGFPYLRGNRFLAALSNRLKNWAMESRWIEALRNLDLAARQKEIRNLPEDQFKVLWQEIGAEGPPDREALMAITRQYSDRLLAQDQQKAGYAGAVRKALKIPDEYSTTMRIAGLYLLASIPVALVTHKVRREFTQWYETPAEALPVLGRLVQYAPADGSRLTSEEIRQFIQNRDMLGLPQLSAAQTAQLAATFAPALIQDVAAPYDRWGEMVWRGESLSVSEDRPAVYYYLSHAFFNDDPIIQINYVIWYPGREGPNAPWMERGHLDGLTFRVSLDSDGVPFMTDFMNNCGCYHAFVPKRERVERVRPAYRGTGPFVARWLPEDFPEKRLRFRVSSGWHQVTHISTDAMTAKPSPYALVPYAKLEALPRPEGGNSSIFDAGGIAKGTERIEPFIFFSMGIREVGSMRQRGHHAIKLVGRAHFDDPDLFDQHFMFK